MNVIEQSNVNRERKSIDYRIVLTAISKIQSIKLYELKNDTLALSTRNVFELNIIYKYTHLSNDNLKEWIGNRIKDETEILDGMLKLSEQPNSSVEEIIQDRINEINKVAQDKNIVVRKQINTRVLAEKVGLFSEYEGLFKLYSKFIHPTSFLINSGYFD